MVDKPLTLQRKVTNIQDLDESCLLSDILVMQPTGRALTSDSLENRFIMVAYEEQRYSSLDGKI